MFVIRLLDKAIRSVHPSKRVEQGPGFQLELDIELLPHWEQHCSRLGLQPTAAALSFFQRWGAISSGLSCAPCAW